MASVKNLFLFSCLISIGAYACPELSAQYANCKSPRGTGSTSSNMVITQSTSNNVTSYQMAFTNDETQSRSEQTLVGDHTPRKTSQTDPITGVVYDTFTTTHCEDDVLVVTTDLQMGGKPFGHLVISMYRLDEGMMQSMEGELFGKPVSQSLICR